MINIDEKVYLSLSPSEKRVFEYIIYNQDKISKMSAQKLADYCNVSKTLVINLTQKIGYDGFSDLRFHIKNKEREEKINPMPSHSSMDNFEKTMNIQQERHIHHAVELILKAKTVYCAGRGSSKHLTAYFAHLLMLLGIKCINIVDLNLMTVIAETMVENDVMIMFSLSGETAILTKTAQVAKMGKGELITVTAFTNNTIASFSDCALYFISDQKNTIVDDTVSRLPMFYIIERMINEIKENIEK